MKVQIDPSRTDYKYLDELTRSHRGVVSRREWLEALESGKYDQWTGSVCDNNRYPMKFCCLGVAVELAGLPFILNDAHMDSIEAGLLIEGMTIQMCDEWAIPLNDGLADQDLEGHPGVKKGANFKEIARFFRMKWPMESYRA